MRSVATLSLVFVAALSISAQRVERVDDAQLPRFEVVSIKPGDPNAPDRRIGTPPDRFFQENFTMENVIGLAFGLRPADVFAMKLSGPLAQPYSIDARMPAGSQPRELGLMLRAMLIDRFKLRYHIDTAERDAYDLVLARRDGRLGSNLRRSTIDCVTRMNAQRRNQEVPALPRGAKACGINNGPGRIDFGGMPLATLATMLSNQTGRPVTDRTGLAGNFDAELSWSLAASAPTAGAAPGAASDGPSIFTAVQEQLGLKLESSMTTADQVVIDHVEPPTPD
jgi:uncharacterized protein (TIGR03435 family)